MASGPPTLHDLACVLHLHSTFSDGTGTVPEIVRAARRAGVDVVLLTDHDTLEARDRGYEGWHEDVLLLVGEEVSPRGGNHYLAFGLEEPIDHRGMGPAEIVRAVADAGGFGFAAHPFSRGSERFRTKPMPWSDLDCEGLAGIEVWSFVTDEGETIGSIRDALRFLAHPERFATGPPEENRREWDRLNASGRRVVGIGGLDAHQIGKRIADRFVVRLMGYARSFQQLRTHVLVDELPTGDLEHDREQVYAALREGRSYMALDSLAPARGFAFWAEEGRLRARLPRSARLRLYRDGVVVHEDHAAELDQAPDAPGSYRVEASLQVHGIDQAWVLSNPLFMRNPGESS